jgi:hypothetical protein
VLWLGILKIWKEAGYDKTSTALTRELIDNGKFTLMIVLI